jgi:phosphatidylglycerol lysyltransferase
MRRGADPMPGVTESVIATAALASREGLGTRSLSDTPPAGVDAGRAPGPVRRIVARLLVTTGRVLEPSYGFASLLRLTAESDPRHETLRLACPDPADPAPIGRVLVGAYVPTLRIRQLAIALRAAGARRGGSRRTARAARRAARRAILGRAGDRGADTGAGDGRAGGGRDA